MALCIKTDNLKSYKVIGSPSMGVALQTVFKGVVYLALPWYNYQPLWCIVVMPWQNP